MDHLLLDQDGVPTLVEVERSSDTRIRRGVVGQMLDYAAAASLSWTSGQIRDHVDAAAPGSVSELIGPEADVDAFWQAVEANLRGGRLRLVFLADRIPPELARIVEFLDGQMELCDARAIELRRFSDTGGTATIVTRSVAGTRGGHRGAGRAAQRPWDEASFSLFPILDLADGRRIYPVAFWASGLVEVQFQRLQPPLDSDDARLAFAERLDRIAGVQIPRDRLRGRPSFPFELVTDDDGAQRLCEALQWCLDRCAEDPPGA